MKTHKLLLAFAIVCSVTAGSLFAGCGHIHAYGKWTTVRHAGCFIEQEEMRVCSGCGETKTRTSPSLGHNYKDGVCTVCGRRDWGVTDITDPALYNSRFCYNALANEPHGNGMQTLYSLIDGDARKYHTGNSNSSVLGEYDYGEYGLTENEAIAVWKVYLDDHPLYYWMSKTAQTDSDDNAFTICVDDEYTNPEVRSSLNKTIYERANGWREDTSEIAYLAALSYHDDIIQRVDYLPYDDNSPSANNIIGVFEGKDVVCESYARTFQLMLNLSGIENILVTGESYGGRHAWNLVKLDDGSWYSFDLTYDDCPGWMWGIKYNYFAVSATDNVNRQDDSEEYTTEKKYFSDDHAADNGTGVNYMPALPEIAENKYEGVGELMLRETFTSDKFTYAHVGHKAVQLVKCTAKGEVAIPARAEHGGIEYKVISIGGMDDYGLFADTLLRCELVINDDGSYKQIYHYYTVFQKENGDSPFEAPHISTLYLPETIRFLWSNAIPAVAAFKVAENNQYYTSADGVLFTKQLDTLIGYPSLSKRSEYAIPDETVYIAHNSFTDIRNLKKLTIGSGVTSDGGRANWGTGWLDPKDGGMHVVNVIVHEFDAIAKYGVSISVKGENPYLHIENGHIRNIDA